MVSTASTNALPMNCPWRNKLSPSPRPRRGVHIVKVCPVDNIYLLCYTATCLSSIAGAGYSSPFPSHQGVHTRWFGRALEWHSRGQRFDPAYLHHLKGKSFYYPSHLCGGFSLCRNRNHIQPQAELLEINVEINVELIIPVNFHPADQAVDNHLLCLQAGGIVHIRPGDDVVILRR